MLRANIPSLKVSYFMGLRILLDLGLPRGIGIMEPFATPHLRTHAKILYRIN